jgi:acetyl esterase/lipase
MKAAASLLIALSCALPSAAAEQHAVRVVRDVAYLPGGNADNKHTLDLYLPDGRPNGPVIVSFYGGALMQGDKNQQTFVGQRFASSGIATAVVNYRLSPSVKHPAHVEDAAAAFAWVKRHIAGYGARADQVFVVGHSAGAYLVALLATDERYLAAEHLSLRDIRGVVPVSAFYWVERQGVAPDRDKSVWGTDQNVWVDASPAHHLHPRVPPILILYADGDEQWRRDQNVEAAQALRAAGNTRVEIVQIAGRTHNSIWSRLNDAGDEVSERIVKFVQETTGLPSTF